MLGWTTAFLVIAVVAGALGFFTLAGVAATIAKVLFFLFIALFIIGFFTGKRPTT